LKYCTARSCFSAAALGLERTEIAALAGLGVDLTGVEPVFAGLQFADHELALVHHAPINNHDGRALVHACDVGDPDAVKGLFAAISSEFGRLDLLFNNAGAGAPAVPIDELTFEQWRTVVDVNLTGAFLCAQGAVALMKKQRPMGGRIVNNGSISAHAPRPHSAPYTATKHAISGLTKSIALDGRPFDIACGQIDIGNALTAMVRKMTTGVPQANGTTAIEPTIDPDEVGDAIVHMAGLPLSTNILTMTIMATKMPFVGRG